MTERESLEQQRRRIQERTLERLKEKRAWMEANGKHYWQRTYSAKPLVLAKGKR